MEYIINGILIIFIILFVLQRVMPVKGVEQISTADLKKKVRDRNYQFVDVRTPMEFKGRHIKGFKNIPLHELKRRQEELTKDKAVILICQSGARSMRAARILKRKGFTKIMNVQGGMSSWM